MSGRVDALRPLPLYVSTRSTAQLLCAVFAVTAAVCWIAAGYDLGEVRMLAAMGEGLEPGARERLAHAEAGRLVGALQLGCVALLVPLFLPWLYHARVNARALGVRRLRFGREWSYLAFLVPGLNLYRPYQVLSEIWRGSDPASDDPLAWRTRPAPPRLAAWWGLFLTWIALEVASALLLEHATGTARLRLAHLLSFAGNAGAGVSASLGCLIVSRLSRAQEAKWRNYGESAPPVSALGPELSA